MAEKQAEAPPTLAPAQQELAKQLVGISQRNISNEAKMQLTISAVKAYSQNYPIRIDARAADSLAKSIGAMIEVLEKNKGQFTGDIIVGKMFSLFPGSTQRQMGAADSKILSDSAMEIQASYGTIIKCLKAAESLAISLRDKMHTPTKRAEYVQAMFRNLDEAMRLSASMSSDFEKLSGVYERSAKRTDTEFKVSAAVSATIGIMVGGWAIGTALGAGIAGFAAVGAATGLATEAAVTGITKGRLITGKEAVQATLLGAVFSAAGRAMSIAKVAKTAAALEGPLTAGSEVAASASLVSRARSGMTVIPTARELGQEIGGAAIAGSYKAITKAEEEREEKARKAKKR